MESTQFPSARAARQVCARNFAPWLVPLLALLPAPLYAQESNPLRDSGEWPALRESTHKPPWQLPQAAPSTSPRELPESELNAPAAPSSPRQLPAAVVADRTVVAASFRQPADEIATTISPNPAEASLALAVAGSSREQSALPAALAGAKGTKPPSANQASELQYEPPNYPAPVDLGDTLGRLMSATLGVLAICGVGLWAARKWLRRLPHAGGAEQAHVLGSVHLGARCMVQLVELQGCKFVVGRDAGGIKAMMSVTQPFADAVEQLERLSPHAA